MAYGIGGSRYRGEQARGRGEVPGAADQDGHEPLHPLHALRALHDRGGGRRGAGRHRPRRGHGDHHLPRARHDVGAVRQRRTTCARSARSRTGPGPSSTGPGSCARPRSIDVMDARGLGHPRRRARPRGAAHPAAQQRCRERGVDLRQDALRRRRAAHAAARPALRPQERPAGAGELGRGAARWSPTSSRRPSRSASAPSPATWRAPRRCSRSRTCSRGSASRNLDCRQDGAKLDPRLGPRQLSVQHRPSRASSGPTRSCSSAPIRASRRPCSTRASASAGARAGCRSA